MRFKLDAACGCNAGRVRTNNEDNFYFCGQGLPEKNAGLKEILHSRGALKDRVCFAVFDGIGGENFGEIASHTAVNSLGRTLKNRSAEVSERLLEDWCGTMNEAVCAQSKKLSGGHMGCTAALVLFSAEGVTSCNIGDSRIYRLRNGELAQLSVDHSELQPGEGCKRKARLSQFLGVFPEELTLEPFILKWELRSEDTYLICSDGLTDMVSDEEIRERLLCRQEIVKCVNSLIELALLHGGKDNVTVIAVRVQ